MDYAAKITQTLDELQQLEKQQTNVANRDHVRFIRLLKEKQANSQKQAAQLINLGLRQGQRIWAKYFSQGSGYRRTHRSAHSSLYWQAVLHPN